MDRSVYEPFLKNGGTPIRCRSKDEVDQLLDDMIVIFPDEVDRLNSLRRVFGSDVYLSEVVFRFVANDKGIISSNFCTYQFYRSNGYEIVEFSDILVLNSSDDEAESSWELEDLSLLLG